MVRWKQAQQITFKLPYERKYNDGATFIHLFTDLGILQIIHSEIQRMLTHVYIMQMK